MFVIMDKQATHYIGEISKNLGISQRTIRYYEELGFIKPSRSEGRFRVYDNNQLNRLKIILLLKELGMSLEDIKNLINICQQGSPHDISPRLHAALLARKNELEAKIKKLRAGIKQLEGSILAIKRCEKCNQPVDDYKCHKCLHERQDELTELIKAIL